MILIFIFISLNKIPQCLVTEQKKIYRVFQLIARLRSPFGASKAALARDFECTERTIERYMVLLADIGFDIGKRNGYFYIERIDRHGLKPEDMIVFSPEEAALVRDAVLSSTPNSPLQKSLLTKLYALTDLDELSQTLYSNSVSRSISTVRRAIRSGEQITLKDYHSVSSNRVSDRLVEPIKFFGYYTYLLALEVLTREVKQFKTDRIGSVEPTGRPWEHAHLHGQKRIDAFGMSGTQPIPVVLRLSTRAHCLMEEEFPDAAPHIARTEDGAIFRGSVYSFDQIGTC